MGRGSRRHRSVYRKLSQESYMQTQRAQQLRAMLAGSFDQSHSLRVISDDPMTQLSDLDTAGMCFILAS